VRLKEDGLEGETMTWGRIADRSPWSSTQLWDRGPAAPRSLMHLDCQIRLSVERQEGPATWWEHCLFDIPKDNATNMSSRMKL
jgi:hypothetical protein